jgi:predicted SAM-dependent methyltransferase
MLDLRHLAKKLVTPFRQYLGRLTVVDRHVRGEGLEIGALQDPMPLPTAKKVRYVDIASTDELRRMYPRKAGRRLVHVDIVDDGETLRTVADGSQDFVVANHFLEHCEDTIGTLRNLLRVVRPGGVVYLSVPDKRHTFDSERASTTVEHHVRDHEDGPAGSRHAHYVDVVQNAMKVQGDAAVAAAVLDLEQRSFRIHFHCWSQTEFLQLLVELQARAGFPRFDVAEFVANEREMIVVLKRLG